MDSRFERMNIELTLERIFGLGSAVVLLLFILSSCIPEPLEVDGIEKVKPQIVVSSQIIPDQTLLVLLTKSFGALNASDDSDPVDVLNQIAINDATVTIESDNQIDTLIFLGNGLYGDVSIPFAAGVDYTLRVNSVSMGEVTATTQAEEQILFEDIVPSLYFDGYDDTLMQVTYSIDDPADKNWYMVNVLKIDSSELVDNLLNPRDFTKLLTDETFNGGSYEETFRVFPREFSKGDTVAVYLSNISEDYYDFVKLRLDNRFSFLEYLSEPINYPSNVKGGKGYFNLYVPDIRFFVLE
jgi:hypothetical protein